MSNAIFIDGDSDATQLRVQGNTPQTNPLQTWEDSTANVLAQVTEDGRLQLGDDLGMATPDALLEAHRDSGSSLPTRGVHSLGRVTGTLSNLVSWMVAELELLGAGGISALHSALRVKLTNSNGGTMSSADLRAGDFEIANNGGSSGSPVTKVTALQAAISNESGGYIDEAVGINVDLVNENGGEVDQAIGLRINLENAGVLNQAYAIHTGDGTVHFGGEQELKIVDTPPTTNPPTDFIKVYPKLEVGKPKLYAKDSGGTEYLLSSDELPCQPIEITSALTVGAGCQSLFGEELIISGSGELIISGAVYVLD